MNKIWVFLAVLHASACTVDKRYEDYQDTLQVEERVAKRWEALIKKDYIEVYKFTVKSYREMVAEKDYVRTRNPRIIWDKFDIMRTRCEDGVCKVNVEVGYHIPPMFGIPMGTDIIENMKETWLQKDQGWYYVPPVVK